MPLDEIKIPVKMSDDYRALADVMKRIYELTKEMVECLAEAASLMDKIKNAAMSPFDKT